MKKWLIIIGIGALCLVVGLVIGLKVFTKHMGRMTVEEAVHFLGGHLRIEYAQKSDNPAAGTIKYNNLKIRPKIHSRFDLDIEECVLALTPGPGPRDLPQRLKARLSGIRPVNPEKVESLAALGYDDLVLEADLDLEIWPDKKRITLRQISLNGDGAGSLFGHLALSGMELDLDTTLAQAREKLLQASLVMMDLEYSDDSLVERLVKARAAEVEKSPEEVLEEAVAHLRERSGEEEDAIKARALAVLAEFIRNPGTVSARARPPEPVPLARIWESKELSSGEWPRELNLVIEAE